MDNQTILVTGGAGYIGSACVKLLLEENYNVIVADNLSKGKRELVPENVKFYHVDLTDKDSLDKVFSENKIDKVIHFAGYKAVNESMKDAVKYSDNIIGTINVLSMMVKHDVKKIVYSSTAAVYGTPEYMPIDENHPTKPISYYGATKLETEKIIDWYSKIHGISYICLRYFNVAGDYGLNYVDPDAQNIMPIIMEVVFGKRDKLSVFGDDYDTRDGTCVRDYIHVADLVDAHIKALNVTENAIINLGTSKGYTVKELITATEQATGKPLSHEFCGRRGGDPASVLALNDLAKNLLGWTPKYDLKEMIESTYKAYLSNQ